MARRRNPVLQWMTTSLALAFMRFAALLPLPLARAMARGLGRLVYTLVPRVRKVGRANLDLAYGDTLSDAEKKHILLRCCQSLATVGVEFAHIPVVEINAIIARRRFRWIFMTKGSHSSRRAVAVRPPVRRHLW